MIHVQQENTGTVSNGRSAVHLIHRSGVYPLPLLLIKAHAPLLWDICCQVGTTLLFLFFISKPGLRSRMYYFDAVPEPIIFFRGSDSYLKGQGHEI